MMELPTETGVTRIEFEDEGNAQAALNTFKRFGYDIDFEADRYVVRSFDGSDQ